MIPSQLEIPIRFLFNSFAQTPYLVSCVYIASLAAVFQGPIAREPQVGMTFAEAQRWPPGDLGSIVLEVNIP